MAETAPGSVPSQAEVWADEVRSTVAKEVAGLLILRQAGQDVDAVQASLAFADGNIAGISRTFSLRAASQGLPGIACRAGCASCCFVRVSVLPVEAFHIASHLKQSLGEDALRDLIERIRSYRQTIESLPAHRRLTTPLACAFLGDDRNCTIYGVRPLACRMHHSLSREACEDPLLPVPIVEDFANSTIPVMEGIHDGAVEAGLVSGELEFAPAMEIALTESQAEERWLQGEDVFAGALDQELRAYAMERLEG